MCLLSAIPRRPQRGWEGLEPACPTYTYRAAVPRVPRPRRRGRPALVRASSNPERRGCPSSCWVQAGSKLRAGAAPALAACAGPGQSPGRGWGVKERTESPRCGRDVGHLAVQQKFCYQELEPYVEDIGTRPPAPQTLAVPAGPSPGGAQPTRPYPDTQGCCLLWPQPHVPTLCWVRSVTAPSGTCRVPAPHPQVAVGSALASGPSSLPFPQIKGAGRHPRSQHRAEICS